jgi:class 3 adenylate cyclase
MRCTRCGTELIPGKRFCHECGARAQIPCPHCGAVVDPQFRFCPDCGGALAADRPPPGAESPSVTPAASAPEQLAQRIPEELARKIRGTGGVVAGERKQVTVLFCDLTGSTEIAERLDPEEYRDLLDQYLDLVFAEIHRHEGVVNQLAGDGLMALFGAPIAHEDAPARALHAALAIQQALGRLRSNGRRLRARIGVHTGPVVVGTVGNDLKMDYTAIGDTTNLASRLQSLAEPGTILASETTQRLTRGLFELRRVGPFEVRGKREPVTAFQVLRPTEATSPMLRAKARGMTPWVARDGELAQLRDCFARLGGSLAQMVSVVGDPGSGKSRLLYEFKRSLEHENAILFEARCSSLTQSVPFAPWKEMLRDYFGLRGDEPAPVAREKIARALDELEGQHEDLPYICHALGIPLDQRDEPSAEHVSQGRFEAISRVVVASARKARAVVIIEDLHWIDEPSRESLERAVSALEETNLMIVVSHRPDYQPNWNVRAAFTQLHLLPLPEADARRILRAQAGGELPEALEKRILRKADGNPFFVEELTRALAEEEHFVRDGEQLRLKRPVDEIRIPDTVQELVGARLDRLTPEAKRVAQVASVFGRQFAREPLGVLLDGEGLDVGAQLQQLEQRGVIHRKDTSSEDEFRFGESFTQEVAYESLLLKERRQLHARIAELLEERFQRSAEPQYSLLAHHYARSEDKARALKALLAAAERAEALPSYREALKLYLDAWKMAEAELDAEGAGPEDFQRAALQATVGLGGVMVVHGMPRRSDPEKPIRRGRLLAERLGDADALARLTALHGMRGSRARRAGSRGGGARRAQPASDEHRTRSRLDLRRRRPLRRGSLRPARRPGKPRAGRSAGRALGRLPGCALLLRPRAPPGGSAGRRRRRRAGDARSGHPSLEPHRAERLQRHAGAPGAAARQQRGGPALGRPRPRDRRGHRELRGLAQLGGHRAGRTRRARPRGVGPALRRCDRPQRRGGGRPGDLEPPHRRWAARDRRRASRPANRGRGGRAFGRTAAPHAELTRPRGGAGATGLGALDRRRAPLPPRPRAGARARHAHQRGRRAARAGRGRDRAR